MTHLHKRFSDEQVEFLLQSYEEGPSRSLNPIPLSTMSFACGKREW